MEDSPASDPRIIVTLIHGTFAPEAAWANGDSPMRQDLKAALGPDVCIRAFNWTGANSIFGRVEASRDLITDFEGVKARYPGAPHYAIAHSHGGTISLYAMHNCPEHARPSGIACLGTPFFHARVRDLSTLDGKTLGTSFFGLLLGLTWLATAIADVSALWQISAIVPCLILGHAAGGFLAGGIREMSKYAQLISDNISVAVTPGFNLLIVRVAGDEVSFTLGTGQFLSWAASQAYSKLSSLQGSKMFRRARLPKAVWLLFAVAVATTISAVIFDAPARGWITLLAQVLLVLSSFAWLAIKTNWLDRVAFGASFVALAAATSLTKVWLGTGVHDPEAGGPFTRWLGGLITALLVDVNTEYSPEGPWIVNQFSRLPDEASGTLVHSTYNDPRVRALIVGWLQYSEPTDVHSTDPECPTRVL